MAVSTATKPSTASVTAISSAKAFSSAASNDEKLIDLTISASSLRALKNASTPTRLTQLPGFDQLLDDIAEVDFPSDHDSY